MTIDDSDSDPSDGDARQDEPTTDPIDADLPSPNRDGLRASRRRFLAASGALTLGSAFGVGTAAGQASGSAPDSFEGFKQAVDETLAEAESVVEGGPYEPTWDSLDDVDPVPEWLRDAKFGIYLHWGLYSIPAYDSEWYPRNMYNVGDSVYEYHVENYGEPDEFPYQEFAPEFDGENFDPDGWVDMFEDAGARFAGMVAKHADGWSNWDSAINPWNAGEMGPERNLVGDLAAAVNESGLRFVTTFHHAYKFGYDYFEYAFQNFPSVTEGYPDRIMYGNLSESLFHDEWLAETIEVLQDQNPDLIYFDSGLETISETNRQRLVAYYYNQAANQDRDVAVTHKQEDLPLDVSMRDYEEGGVFSLLDQAWLIDVPISTYSWGYVQDQEYKSVDRLLEILVDSVSKNGQLMLNVSPRADGTIPQAQQERLEGVGDWLETNGEAIYETRPWDLYGTGPHWGEGYDAQDVRYTQSKDGESVYAIVMGWPEDDTVTLDGTYVEDDGGPPESAGPPEHSNAPEGTGPPDHAGSGEVTLLGHGSVPYCVDPNGHLRVKVPDQSEVDQSGDLPVAFELSGFELRGITADYTLSSSDIYVARVEEDLHEITVTVYNFARGEAPATTVRVENASTGEVIGEADVESLGLYGNTEATVEWDTSEFEDGTTQKVRAVVDPDDEVPEQDESNNSATTTVELPAWPVDLVPDPVGVSDMEPGSWIELSATVRNVGTEPSDATSVRLMDVTGDEPTRIATLDLPAIEADSSATATYQWDGIETGETRQVEAIVDPEDVISERDESNNTSEPATVRLLGPLPEGYDTTSSTEATFGEWNSNFVINANGVDIWEDHDEYGAIYRSDTQAGSTATATVKVVDQESQDDWAKAGIMIRNDVTAAGESAGYAAVMVTLDSGFEFEWDSDGNGYVDDAANTGESVRPCWLRLQKDGTTFTASYSTDGSSWTEIGSATVEEAADTQDVAMFSTSHMEDALGTAEFDQFDVE